MSEGNNKQASLKPCATEGLKKAEISALFDRLSKNHNETNDIIHSLQKSLAGLREQIQDFRAEIVEDNSELRRKTDELRRNKVWIPRESV
jgi:chromosome segregation ATPase